ncbi:MAG: ATP-binding protein [candidate division WOR-3 bacterium]
MANLSRIINPALSSINKVIKRYKILEKNSGLVVGVSGGSDSLVLLYLLCEYNEKFNQNYEIYACHIRPDFPDWNTGFIENYCKWLEIPCKIINIKIDSRLQSVEKKCFFCSRQRRRKLLEYAESLNIFKVALAHHLEDVVETFLLNVIYNGEISTIVPSQSVIQGRFSFVRPIYYLDKKIIDSIARVLNIPVNLNKCPYYQISKRQKIRNFLNDISIEYPEVYNSIFNGIMNIKRPYLPA